jgi:hypothetical protein
MSLTAIIAIAISAAASLMALLGIAERLGLPSDAALALAIPVMTIPLIVAYVAGATLESQRFLAGRKCLGRRGVALLSGSAALLLIAQATGQPPGALIAFIPAMWLGVIGYQFLRRKEDASESSLSFAETLRAHGAPGATASIAATISALLMTLALLALLPSIATPMAALSGLPERLITALIIGGAALSAIIGGWRCALSLSLAAAVSTAAGLLALFIGFWLIGGFPAVPFLSSAETLEPIIEAVKRFWQDVPATTHSAAPWAAIQAAGVTAHLGHALAVTALLCFFNLEASRSYRYSYATSASASLIAVPMLALAFAMIPLNSARTLTTQIAGYAPDALPLWIADGRFSQSLIVCGRPLDTLNDKTALCPQLAQDTPIGIADIAPAQDFLMRMSGLAAGLPTSANAVIAILLAMLGVVLFLMIFGRIMTTIGHDLAYRLRRTPSTGSWRLAIVRVMALVYGAVIFMLSGMPINPPTIWGWVLCLFAPLVLPALIGIRFAKAHGHELTAAIIAGPAVAALFRVAGTGFEVALLAGCASGIAAIAVTRIALTRIHAGESAQTASG